MRTLNDVLGCNKTPAQQHKAFLKTPEGQKYLEEQRQHRALQELSNIARKKQERKDQIFGDVMAFFQLVIYLAFLGWVLFLAVKS